MFFSFSIQKSLPDIQKYIYLISDYLSLEKILHFCNHQNNVYISILIL